MDWMELLFSTEGRLGRRRFWIATLVLVVVSAPFRLMGPIGALVTLALIYPHICIFVKRLHDIGRSGWQTAIPWGLILGGAFLYGVSESIGGVVATLGETVGGLLAVAAVFFGFWVGFRRGDSGENAYGPPPGLKAEPSTAS